MPRGIPKQPRVKATAPSETKVDDVVKTTGTVDERSSAISEETIDNINKLDEKLNDFMFTVGKSKVAVIIPLFGYWNTVKKNPLNLDLLKLVMDRVYSSIHETYIILVADPARIPSNVVRAMEAKNFGGNVIGVSVGVDASYADYIANGMDCALTETQAQFVVVVNPWVIIQHGAIDRIINRVNRGDVGFVSGYDVTGDIKQDKLDHLQTDTPQEFRDLDLNFIAMIRAMAEMIQFSDIKTSGYFTKDLLQGMYRKGYEAITSQVVPIYSFDINITNYENEDDYVNDRIAFIKKWGFDPDLS